VERLGLDERDGLSQSSDREREKKKIFRTGERGRISFLPSFLACALSPCSTLRVCVVFLVEKLVSIRFRCKPAFFMFFGKESDSLDPFNSQTFLRGERGPNPSSHFFVFREGN